MNEPSSDQPSDPKSRDPKPGDPRTGDRDQKVRIQHELVRVRRQAEVARLEANAARLEASAEHLKELIERIDAGEVLSEDELSRLGSESRFRSDPMPSHESLHVETSPPVSPHGPVPRFDSWDAIRKARAVHAEATHSDALHRVDTAHPAVRRPRMQTAFPATDHPEADVSQENPEVATSSNDLDDDVSVDSCAVAGTFAQPLQDGKSDGDFDNPMIAPVDEPVEEPVEEPATGSPIEVVTLADDNEAAPKRRHPMALVVSAVIHFLILFILAGFTLSNAMPKDQVALSASTSESSESAMETFQIEAVEPTTEPTETTSDETQYDISPLGEMASVDVTSDVVAAVSQPMASMASLSQPNLNNSSALKALKSDSQSKMEFCGVEGGGNHFVYLVDSSGSMGDAFASARRALLDSIEMLTPEQRFYVIFFDANCDYMRITRADQDEPRSVYATPENKSQLKAWAMRVSMDRGRAPYEPLQYALETLKPDVIFLLSDGEFPAKIEDILKENNVVRNLFGDESPVSIIHTISYYSREGESRMRRIAEQNHGQYRHVPKPESR